jgi:predicted phage terminase large subunit-like protein
LTDLAALISKLPENEQQKLLAQVSAYKEALEREKAQADFMSFVKMMWPSFIHGRHHALMAKELEAIANNESKRLIMALPPRHTKSLFASYLFPAWFLGKYPDKKIIQASNTAELAVGFGRQVRNLVGSDIYKKVFPDVDLRADSKAAGRWSTNHGGEYYACVSPQTLVKTQKGLCEAIEVCQNDYILSAGKFQRVLSVMFTTHNKTVVIDSLKCSTKHPIYVGTWKFADDVCVGDLLYVESIWDSMKALIWRVCHGYLEYTNVPEVVQHQVTVPQPKKRKISKLRWARDISVRALAHLRQLCARYGSASNKQSHGWPNRKQWPVCSRELPMGDAGTASKQPQEQCTHRWENIGATRQATKFDASSNKISNECWARSVIHGEKTETILRSYDHPKNIGWYRSWAFRILERCSAIRYPVKHKTSAFIYLESARRAAAYLCGVLLGVRPVIHAETKEHEPRRFINYAVDGDNTFNANGILTHNCGVGGTMTGKGADLLIIDDPHSEGEAKLAQSDPSVFDGVYEWYTSGPRQRLQPNGKILIIATRWSDKDLTGKVLRNSRNEDEWKVIELPAILPSGKPLWPEFWSLKELEALKEELPPYKWNAQYQQQPTGEAGAIVKREWWRRWDRERPPPCEFIIQSWDTAFTKNERSDYSACTTWGVFNLNEDPNDVNIILLDAFQDKWEFPELKQQAHASWKEWQPDAFIIEAKAAGAPLIFELRRMGIPVSEYTPSRGNDKFARINSVTDLFSSGKVWAPDTRWADDVIEQMARFPNAEHDDLCDSAVQALIRFRQGGFLRLQSDEEDEPMFHRRRPAYY